jgi:phage terminase large subunit-like protein
MNNQEYIKAVLQSSKTNIFWQLQKHRQEIGEVAYYKECEKYAGHSFLCFIQAIKRENFELRDFHFVIAALLEHMAFLPENSYKRIILAAPPRSGKSTITQLFTAWLTGLNPLTGHIFASYGQRLSSRFMTKIHAIVADPIFLRCFPNFEGFNQGSKTELCSGGTFTATSVGGAVTGFDAGSLQLPVQINQMRRNQKPGEILPGTPGLLTVDDPLKNGASEAELSALDDWWTDEFNTRRTGNWMQMLIATRFSLNDLHGKLLKWDGIFDTETNPEGWVYLNITALALEDDILGREPGSGLWENHPTLNTKELLKLQIKNPQRFGALYMGNPAMEESGRVCSKDLRPEENPPESFDYQSIAIDCASGLSADCDNTSISLIGIDNQGKPWVIQNWAENIGFVALRELVKEICSEYEIDKLCVELNNNGVALFQELEHDPDRFCFEGELVGFQPKHYGSKEKRLSSAMDLLQQLFWTNELGSGIPELRKELLAFPFGANDDRVDSLSWNLIANRNELENFELDNTEQSSQEQSFFDYNSFKASLKVGTSSNEWGF